MSFIISAISSGFSRGIICPQFLTLTCLPFKVLLAITFISFDETKASFSAEINKIGIFKVEVNFHSEVKAIISIKIDKIQSK